MEFDDFFHSCYTNNLNSVQDFLKKDISPNIQNNEGVTALQIAATNGYMDLANLLLEGGAVVDLPNNYGWTPLMLAARQGNTAIVTLLLKRKAKVNICNKLGLRPIVAAAWGGQLSTIKVLIEAGAVVNHMPSYNKQGKDCDLSSLMAASLKGHDSILHFLLEKGAVVNQASPITGLTPLMLASCNGYKQIVQIIVEWGGDANRIDNCNRTALDIATLRSKREVTAYLENLTYTKFHSEKSSSSNIFYAVRIGDIVAVESLLQLDSHLVNITDTCDGSTPLMLGAMLGHLNIVHLLVSSGAHLDIQDSSNGWTAIMHAVFHRHSDIVSYLVEAGANVAMPSFNGYAAIDLARHLDGYETNIVNALTMKSGSSKQNQKSTNLLSSCQTDEASNSIKSCSSNRGSPRKSQQTTRFKGWIDEVSQKFQQRIFSRHSAKVSSTLAIPPDIQICDVSEDVFIGPNSPHGILEESKLSISTLLSPNKRLSSSLRKHSVEAICPPLLSSSNCDSDLIRKLSPINLCDRPKKKSHVSLQTPNLLKAYYRQNSKGSNSESSYPIETSKRTSRESIHYKKCLSSSDVDFMKSTVGMYPKDQSMSNHQTSGSLTQLLNQESLQKYVEKFREQEVDIEAFKCLTEDDLKEIGIKSINSQNKLLEMIDHVQNKK